MNRSELVNQIKTKRSFLCVGLDTDLKKVPAHILNEEDPIFAFNKAIIDATADYCVAYKPNLAFYEAFGVKGLISFEKTINYLKENYPNHFIVADAKRGDIGNTSAMYARTFFEEYDVDSLTVAPYMGEDSVTPFLGYDGKWVIVLALTSNKGSHDFQCYTGQNVRGHPQDSSPPLLARSRRRRSGRLTRRSLQIRNEQRVRFARKQLTWHYLRIQRRRLRYCSCRES